MPEMSGKCKSNPTKTNNLIYIMMFFWGGDNKIYRILIYNPVKFRFPFCTLAEYFQFPFRKLGKNPVSIPKTENCPVCIGVFFLSLPHWLIPIRKCFLNLPSPTLTAECTNSTPSTHPFNLFFLQKWSSFIYIFVYMFSTAAFLLEIFSCNILSGLGFPSEIYLEFTDLYSNIWIKVYTDC